MSFASWLIRRWWFWCVLAPLALLVLTALTIRWTGQLAWWREQEAARAAGVPVTFADVVALAPPVDAARQERLSELDARIAKSPWVGKADFPRPELAALWSGNSTSGRMLMPADRDTYFAGCAEAAAEFSTLCESGTVVTGTAGWLRGDWSQPMAATGLDLLSLRRMSSAMQIALVDAWAQQLLADSVSPALQRLDDLAVAGMVICDPLDVPFHVRLAARRDSLYLTALARGTLDPQRCAAWLREPPDATASHAQGLLCGRAELLPALCNGLADEWRRVPLSSRANLMHAVLTALNDNVFLPLRAARDSRRARALAAALLGGPIPADWPAWDDKRPAGMTYSDLRSTLVVSARQAANAVAWDNRHRQIRAAARVILAWRAALPAQGATALPADGAAAEACMGDDLHASPHLLPPLVYERLSSTRFRLGIDPLGPLPAFMDAERLAKVPRIGRPSATAAVVDEAWSLEIDCAQMPHAGASHGVE